MTHSEFKIAATRVRFYGNMALAMTGILVVSALAIAVGYFGPWLTALGNQIRNQVQDEVLGGLVGGLLASVLVVPVLLLVWLPAFWVDRRIGVRCPNCKRSVTLRCRHLIVLETGRCTFCQHALFEPPGS
ncbi:MAG: hypothetical protein RIC55_13440 [Pirellulaceae bacterium]